MDPNADEFSILLSYVNTHRGGTTSVPPPEPLLSEMPYLIHPKVLKTMIESLPDLSETHSFLRTLGPRPDPSSITTARAKMAEIEIERSLNGDGVGRFEMKMALAVLKLEDMYVKLLTDADADAEEKLVRVHGAIVRQLEKEKEEEEGEEGVDEEVVAILKKAATATAMEEVEKIELYGRGLRFLPKAFGKLHGLTVLNLSHNELEAIPDSIAGLQKLEELDVSSNILEYLPDSIGELVNLKILNVSRNELHALPGSIVLCSSLEELDASFNNLTYLPANIGFELINLKKLSIYLNKIHNLPDSICEMRCLRYLDAHLNELFGLPHAIGRLTNLEILNISNNYNDLTELPETIGDLTNLKEVDLSNNQIYGLPITFGKLQNLTKLNLDNNPLKIPPMHVVSKGVEAVMKITTKVETNKPALTGQLAMRAASTSTGYLGEGKTYRDPYLDHGLGGAWPLQSNKRKSGFSNSFLISLLLFSLFLGFLWFICLCFWVIGF